MAHTISVCLADSVISKRNQGVKGAHRALFHWLNCNEASVIEESYPNWEKSQDKQNTGLT